MFIERFYVEPMTYTELERMRIGMFDLWIRGRVHGNMAALTLHTISVIRLKVMILTVLKESTKERALAITILRENQAFSDPTHLLTVTQKQFVLNALQNHETTGLELYDVNVTPDTLLLLLDLLHYAAESKTAGDLDRVIAFLMSLPLTSNNKDAILSVIKNSDTSAKTATTTANTATTTTTLPKSEAAVTSEDAPIPQQRTRADRDMMAWLIFTIGLGVIMIVIIIGLLVLVRDASPMKTGYAF